MESHEIDLRTQEYVSIRFRRWYNRKQITVWQDGKGDLIIDYDGERVVDERIK